MKIHIELIEFANEKRQLDANLVKKTKPKHAAQYR